MHSLQTSLNGISFSQTTEPVFGPYEAKGLIFILSRTKISDMCRILHCFIHNLLENAL